MKKLMANELVTVVNNTVLSFDQILMIYLLFLFRHRDDQSPTAIWSSMNRQQLLKRIPRICRQSSLHHAILTRIGKDRSNLEITCLLSCGSDKPYKTASTRTKIVAVFVRSRTQSTQRSCSLATVAHWLLTRIIIRGTGVDLRYQMDV